MAKWRTAKVFISSTFRDMHAERDHLVKVVFPELRERLLPYRVYLDDIDLRWGITEEESKKDKVLDLCLQQIDECRPFFIGILGERYGWVPATPLSREAARRFEKYGKTQLETGQSVTELEILFGVLLMDPRMKGRSFFYFRDPRFLNTVARDRRREVRHQFQEFPSQEEVQQLAYKQARREAAMRRLNLRRLKQKIRAVREHGYPVFENYKGRWDPTAFNRPTKSKGRLLDLDEFGRQVRDQLWEAIKAEFELPDKPPAPAGPDEAARLAAEADDQARFVESRLRVYVGREGVQRALVAYALSNEAQPCLVTGPSGSGKSAALAQFVDRAAMDLPGVPVIAHFIGASPRSTALRDMLKRLCSELYDKLLKTEKQIRLAEITVTGKAAEEQRQAIEQEFTIPEEIAPLVTTWRNFLKMVPEPHRVVIVLDALNQLEEADRARELWWLPHDVCTHVKVIASCIVEPKSVEAEADPVALGFLHRPYHPVRVSALTVRDALTIVKKVPSLSAKNLDRKQRRRLLENPATENPLYLKVALEELRGFGSFEELNDRIAALPRPGLEDAVYERVEFSAQAMLHAGEPLTALFTQVIQRLEDGFSSSLVHDVLTMLAAARRGLSERELQEFLADHPDADDLFPILRQLRPNLTNRTGLLGFFHAGLDQAVRRYYLDTEHQQRAAHRRLAESFAKQDFFLESLEAQRERARRLPPTPRPANVRKVDELPWQCLLAQEWDHLAELLKDLFFLEAKAEAGLVFELVRDFAYALDAIPEGHARRRILRLFDEAIHRDVHFVNRHPTTFFQCIWNSCAWPTAPEMLRTIVNHWRVEHKAEAAGQPWLRSLRRPAQPLGSGERLALRLSEIDRTGSLFATFSVDQRFIVSSECSGQGRVIRFWDTATGAEVSTIAGGYIYALAPDQRTIAWAKRSFDVLIQDTLSGTTLGVLCGHTDYVHRIAFSAGGHRLASSSSDKTIRLWDVVSRLEVACLEVRDDLNVELSFSPDGTQLAMASRGQVTVIDTRSGAALKQFRVGLEHGNTSLRFSPDGWRFLISGTDASGNSAARLHNSDSGELIVSLNRGALCFSPDGRRLASIGLLDDTIRILDITDGRELTAYSTKPAWVRDLAFSPNGKWLASAESDGAIRVRDTATGAVLGAGYGHSAGPDGVEFSPDGRYLVSASRFDRTVRVWELGGLPADSGPVLDDHLVSSVWFAAGGKHLVVQNARSLRLVEATANRPVATLMDNAERMRCPTVSPDGRWISAVNSAGGVHVWDARTGKEVVIFDSCGTNPTVAVFATDGKWIALGAPDGSVAIHDVASGNRIRTVAAHRRAISCLAIAPNGTYLATGSTDGTTCVWELSGQKPVRLFESKGMAIYNLGVFCLTFSPDLKHLAAAGVDGIRVWEVDNWTEVARLSVNDPVVALAFGPEGRLVSQGERPNNDAWTMPTDPSTLVGESGIVHVWDIRSSECVEQFEGRGDISRFAGRDSLNRFLVRSDLRETIIESRDDRGQIAFGPVSFERVTVDQNEPIVAGIADDRLYVFAIEGSP